MFVYALLLGVDYDPRRFLLLGQILKQEQPLIFLSIYIRFIRSKLTWLLSKLWCTSPYFSLSDYLFLVFSPAILLVILAVATQNSNQLKNIELRGHSSPFLIFIKLFLIILFNCLGFSRFLRLNIFS